MKKFLLLTLFISAIHPFSLFAADNLGHKKLLVDCAGAPAVANTVSSQTDVCSGENFTLSLDITYSETGISYQWQSSPDGFSYTDIGGATTESLITNQTSTTFYQCVITCTVSGMSTVSIPVSVGIHTPPATVSLTSDDADGMICPGTTVIFTGDGTHDYYDFQINNISVQAGSSNIFTTSSLNNNDQVTVLAGFSANCNTTSNTIVITHHSVPSGSVTSTNVTCNGLLNGSINLTVSGGTGPYDFDWDNDGTGDFDDTEDLSGLAAGTYIGVVRDANGCTDGGTVIITEPALLTASSVITNISCNGLTDGSIDITISGGTPGYALDWDIDGTGDFDDTEDLTALAAGNYNFEVVDGNGCSATASATIIEPVVLSSSLVSANLQCNNDNSGTIDLTVTGGTSPFSFDWDNDGTGDNDDTEDLSSLNAGNYNVTVTDNRGCTTTNSATLTEPSAINVVVSTIDVTCFSFNNGSINLTVSGGAGGYTFDWDNDGTGDFDDTEDLTNLTAGIYNGVVMDADGCTDGGSVTINQPALLVATRVITHISCNGLTDGAINVSVTGGTAGYLYDWDIDGTGDNNDTEDLSLLSAGTYNLTVTDVNGCTATTFGTIIEPAILSSSLSSVNILCNGDNTGSINLTPTGGTTPYQYDWDNDGTGDFNDPQDLNSRPAGTYNVVIRDNRNCTTTNSVTLTQPSPIVSNVTSVNISCFGQTDGSIDLTVSGGVGGFTFDWDIDGTGDFDDTEDLSGLAAGTYNGVLMDANGCTDGGSVIIVEPGLLDLTISSTDISCNGLTDGSIDLTVNGGTSPFTYDWDTDGLGDNNDAEDLNSLSQGNYFVSVTDSRGCNDTLTGFIIEPDVFTLDLTYSDVSCATYGNGQTDVIATGGTLPYYVDWSNDGTGDGDDSLALDSLLMGTYSIYVTDANNCAVLDSTFNLNEPAAIVWTTVTTNSICDNIGNGSVDLIINGGTGTFTYLWSNNATSQDLTNVQAGIYYFVAFDANGCSVMGNDTVDYDNLAPTVSLVINPDTICNTSATVTISGGNPTGGVFSGTGISGSTFNPSVAGVGTFAVVYTYTDVNGCFGTAVDMITVDDCTGIDEVNDFHFSMYPNPTENSLTLETNYSEFNVVITDMFGKTVMNKNVNNPMVTLDIQSLPAGIYMVNLSNEKGFSSRKLIKK